MSLILTRINDAIASGNLDKNELRGSRYGALDAYMMQTADPGGIVTEDLRMKAMSAVGVDVKVPVIDYDGTVTIGNTRSAVIADSENTSKFVTLSFATYAFGFTVVPSLYMNNEIGMQRDFEAKLRKYINKLGATLDTAALAALALGKTTVFADTLQYAVVGDAVQSAWTERENIIGDLDVILAANDFYDRIHLIGNGGAESVINKLAQKGVYNSENKQMEYMGKSLHYTNRLTNGVGEYGNMYAVPAGQLGVVTRLEREALLGTRAATGHEWGTAILPGLGLEVGTYYYESVGDYSAIAGASSADMTRVMKQHYGFAVDLAFIEAYNSDPGTRASGITKATILAAP